MPADPSVEPEAPALPRDLKDGRFRVFAVLGRGAHAETLDGVDVSTGTPVAIKRFQVRGKKSWKEIELAEREARVLSSLNHPNLPKYIDHFEEGGALYLVMEKLEGPTLGELRKRGALKQAEVARFLADVGQTLDYLHGHAPPIIHRDIKPENVIRRTDGSFALVDFGSVRDRLRPEGGSTVVGTFGYMAPEQFQGRAVPATDLYGVGATALACLSGEEPENLPHRGLALDVRAALGANVDPVLLTLVERLLEPDPDRRPPNLRAAVQQALFEPEPEPAAALQTEWRHPRELIADKRGRRPRSFVGLAIAALVLGFVFSAARTGTFPVPFLFAQRHWLGLLITAFVVAKVFGARAPWRRAERLPRAREPQRVRAPEDPRVRVPVGVMSPDSEDYESDSRSERRRRR